MQPEDISLVGVSKVFQLGLWKRKLAVDSLSLSVPRGQVVGLLGPNGSGKSTTLKMILGFLRPTLGEVIVCGKPAYDRTCRRFIGYLPENPRFPRFLSGSDLLQYYGSLLELRGAALRRRGEELLDLVGLRSAAHERVQGYSKGMTQRLAIAQSLLASPRLLIFDEPMSGLDPAGRIEIRQLILRIHQEMREATIFFSSHILGDVEDVCSFVAMLRNGRLTKAGKIEELVAKDSDTFRIVARDVPIPLRETWASTKSVEESALGVTIGVVGADDLVAVLSELRKAGASIVSVGTRRTRLERALFSDEPITQEKRA